MIKGHVQVDLHNHKTGLRDRIEGDNMITNAMNYVIPNLIGAGVSASEIMPLCQRVLGGIMLFDGKLTEDKNNIFFHRRHILLHLPEEILILNMLTEDH